MEQDIHIYEQGSVGRVTLMRPQALNALTHDMGLKIEEALITWLEKPEIELVMIDAQGERAFCAGGDVAELYEKSKSGNFEYGRTFWRDEYRLNALIKNYTIPYIAFMDGITMGGGVGISAHGSDRIVTENSLVAMPECTIGLVPDVGGNLILANAPNHLGEFLGMSGYRMNSGDAVLAGFADIQVASNELDALKSEICEEADLSVISKYGSPPDTPSLSRHLQKIEKHFSKETAIDCLLSLEGDPSDWCQKIAGLIRKACPLAVACAFELVRQSRMASTIEEVLKLEYRFTYRSMSDGEMIEGIRAQIIDKDRKPNWKFKRLEDVPSERIEAMLAPLNGNEMFT